jgi:hypothetical protein
LVYDNEHDARVYESQLRTPDLTDALMGVGVTFHSAQRFPRGVSLSDGRQVRLTVEDSDVLSSDYSGEVTKLDWREYIRLPGRHALALRWLAGHGTGFPRPFRLGGIATEQYGHPLALPTQALFNQRQFALRGYPSGLGTLFGDQVILVAAEWRFPLALIERGTMAPPLGIHKIYGDVFVNGGEAWYDGLPKEDLRWGAGAELHTEVVLGYWITLDTRLGFAKGFDAGGEQQLYLTVGTSY